MEEIDEMYDSMVENDTDIDDDDDDGAIIAYATAYAVAAANNRCGPRGKPVFEKCLQLFLNVKEDFFVFFLLFQSHGFQRERELELTVS